jgi:hypothetical protein
MIDPQTYMNFYESWATTQNCGREDERDPGENREDIKNILRHIEDSK